MKNLAQQINALTNNQKEELVSFLDDKSRDCLFGILQHKYLTEDVITFGRDSLGKVISKEDAETIADLAQDRWDSNLSHWTNIENAIERAGF